jgi:alpha-L-fucosidase 2
MNKMKGIQKPILLLIVLGAFAWSAQGQNPNSMKMWYSGPAKHWNEALPIGNGRLGAMVFGDPAKEKLQLNEETFWSGSPNNNDNPAALQALPEIRNLIFSGNYSEAQKMADTKIRSQLSQGAKYLPVGNLEISFPGHSNYSGYRRELDIAKAVHTSTYTIEGITFKREVFASQPGQVIVMRLSADQKGKISFTASLNGPLQTSVKALNTQTIEMTGLSSTHEGVTGKVKFNARAYFVNTGGTVVNKSSTIEVDKADEVVVFISIATNFVDYKTLTADETAKCEQFLAAAISKSYNELFDDHVNAYQEYFNRVHIDLGNSDVSNYPTDMRIKNFSRTQDPELVALYYQFGRYLLIGSSQPGGQPANLQGIWNESTNPSWDSKYTININTEMNYWPAEKTNLTELHGPLVQMLKELSVTGHQTAQAMYGAKGWVTHHNTDLWRICGPVDAAYYSIWPMGGAWLTQHLWEKFIYGGDLQYLDSVYPVMKGASEFFNDFLVEEPKNKWLVVCPSHSPENNPSVNPGVSIAAGATIDNQIVFDLFTKTIKAAQLLNKDSAFIVELEDKLKRLPPMQIGKHSQLQEWMEDWDSPSDKNRHVSHLYGLFPSNQISPYRNPELFDAARTSLIYRGDISTGWSMGWKVNFWARLLDGNHALKLITDQLTLVDPVNPASGGTYPNLLDAHPPFQIDGNFGCTSGITEMLLQSHDGAIHFLPALPDRWKKGEINGLRAYGGFEVSFSWDEDKVQSMTIHSALGGNCRLRVPNQLAFENGNPLDTASGENPNPFFEVTPIKEPLVSPLAKLNKLDLGNSIVYEFQTEPGKDYALVNIVAPYFRYAAVWEDNPGRLELEVSEKIKMQDTYSGFMAKVDNALADIDSVRYDTVNAKFYVYLKSNIVKDNVVTISYKNGDVVSMFGKELGHFSDAPVDNLLIGSPPRIEKLETNEDGTHVFAYFNKKMALPSSAGNLSMTAGYQGSKNIAFTGATFHDNDSTILSFSTSEKVYADYLLTLSYTGSDISSNDGGGLANVNQMEVHNLSKGLPLELKRGEVHQDGQSVRLYFNKTVAFAIEQSNFFDIDVDGAVVPVVDFFISDSSVTLYPAKKIYYGNEVKAGYTPGAIMAKDKGELEAFSDVAVLNPIKEPAWIQIPGKIEAENATAQSGTQVETTSDAGGGKNVGYIDAGDWLEYAVNIESDTLYTFTFRLASPNTGGIITIMLNGGKIGQVNASNTGSWQVWESVKIDLNLEKGKHYLKLYVTKGGFNINWINIEKKTAPPVGKGEMKKGQVNIFPNPTRGNLCVSSPGFVYSKIEIIDNTGRVVHTVNGYKPEQQIDVELAYGSYLVVLSNKNETIQENIVFAQ